MACPTPRYRAAAAALQPNDVLPHLSRAAEEGGGRGPLAKTYRGPAQALIINNARRRHPKSC